MGEYQKKKKKKKKRMSKHYREESSFNKKMHSTKCTTKANELPLFKLKLSFNLTMLSLKIHMKIILMMNNKFREGMTYIIEYQSTMFSTPSLKGIVLRQVKTIQIFNSD